jgi:O-antigen/teichoic acid export membrane protein
MVAGLLWFAAPALVTLLNPSQGVNKLAIGLLLVGSATTALAGIMNVGILAGGKTQLALFATLATGVVQIVLLFLLTPIWGVVAAAFSSCVAGCMSLVLQNVLSQRLHRVPYAYGKMFSVAVFALAAICVLSSLDGLGDIARIVVFAIALSLVASATVRFDGFRRQ